MSASEIGQQLCDLCSEGKNLEAIETLYSDEVVSVEAAPMEGMAQTMEGKDAVRGKNEWWFANNEVHDGKVSGPYPHGEDKFAVHFAMDVTNNASGQRMDFQEIALYTVSDGKIVKEEFFYGRPN